MQEEGACKRRAQGLVIKSKAVTCTPGPALPQAQAGMPRYTQQLSGTSGRGRQKTPEYRGGRHEAQGLWRVHVQRRCGAEEAEPRRC